MDPEKYPVFIRFGPAPLGTFDPPEDKHDMKFVRYTWIFKEIIITVLHSAYPWVLGALQWKTSIEAAFEMCIHVHTHMGKGGQLGWAIILNKQRL